MNADSAHSLPFVSVIVPVWNSPELIATCLSALTAQTYPRDRFEVLVVDNASTDSTAEVARGFPIATLLVERTPGSYHARNHGLKEARGEYIAFTDSDCIPDPDWIEKAVENALRHPEAGVLAGRIELFRTSPKDREVYEWYERLFSFRQDVGAQKGFCATANWVSPRDAILAAGSFQADRKSGSDGELAARLLATGRPIIYVKDMVVHHPVRGTFQELARKRRRLTGGRWQRTQSRARPIRVLWTILWDTARRLRSTVIDDRLSLVMRVKVACLVIALSSVAIGELLRLSAHGQAARA
jgi:glycosyltransferase involved in cell wall biosynthesis